jgi:hypothetical protein
MACRPLLAVVATASALAAGCSDEPEASGPPTPERVQNCLSEREDLAQIASIPPGRPDVSSLTAAQHRALTTALEASEAALGVHSGGPFETDDGGIADAPIGATELHFFSGVVEAQDAVRVVEPVIGSPDESVLNGVAALGPVLVVHYSFGMGDMPGGIGIEEDLEPVQACMREVGYLKN